jgi:parallel beta-helix repeat protein
MTNDGAAPREFSRRRVLALGATVLAADAIAPAAATAQTAPEPASPWIVVDPQGDGDFRTVEAALERTRRAATIHLVAGVHEVRRTLRPAAGIRLEGEGEGTILRAEGGDGPLLRISEDRTTLTRLRLEAGERRPGVEVLAPHARLDGCVLQGAERFALLAAAKADHLIVRACRVLEGAGIELDGPSHASLQGNVLSEITGDGILCRAGGFTALSANVVRDCSGEGIFLIEARDTAVVGNTCTATQDGIRVGAGSVGITITANVCTAARRDGIGIAGTRASVVADNTVEENGRDGIRLEGAGGCTISGNVVNGNGTAGIALRDSRDCVCSGNSAVQNGDEDGPAARRSGIVLEGIEEDCSGNLVSGNSCSGGAEALTQMHGIALLGRASGNLLAANLLGPHEGGGLLVEPTALGTDAVPWRRVDVEVDEAEVSIEHGLSYRPLLVSITMTSAGQIWGSSAADARHIFLRADGPGRSAQVLLG